MAELKGIEYLKKKLEAKRTRVLKRYVFYEMKNIAKDFGISTPPNLKHFNNVLGWCAKSVDTVADRLTFNEFRNDYFGLNEIYSMNSPDILFDSASLSALVSSCSFLYITPGKGKIPRIQAINGANATGVMDPITYMLTEGYVVLSRDDNGAPVEEAYLTAYRTEYYRKGSKDVTVLKHNAPFALLVPVIHRPDAMRPFGHARISRAQMSIVESALRTLKRSEISAEFYSFPQRWISGLAEDAEIDRWKATMSALITLTKDEDGDHPVLGQFQQQSMTPYTEQLKMFASLFAGETGLTMDDLGFATSNPASEESIKASHENLRLTARKAQRSFGIGFLNAGYLAACLRDGKEYERSELYMTRPVWEPLFEPGNAALSTIGDGALKLNQAIPGYIDEQVLGDLTGIKKEG